MSPFKRCAGVRRLAVVGAVCLITMAISSTAEAAIVKGLQEVVAGLLQLPLSTLSGTFHGPPVIGTVVGAASGLLSGVGLIAQGVLDLAVSGAAVAKAAAPYVLPFVL